MRHSPSLKSLLLFCLMTLTAATALAQESVVFYESFDKCDGRGGGPWSGNVASSDLKADMLDNEGWSFTKGYAANKCIKLGTGSVIGQAVTPAIDLAGTATLTFKAGAWDYKDENTTLVVTMKGGTLSEQSVTLEKGKFTTYTLTITGGTSGAKITFAGKTAKNNRFFLDEVKIYAGGEPAPGPGPDPDPDPSPEKKNPGLAFTPSALTVTLGEPFTAPVLSNPYGLSGIVYSSSDGKVATADAATGKLTVLGAGTATVTATFAGNDAYKAGSASYSLTVKESEPGGGEEKPGGGDPSDGEPVTTKETIPFTSDFKPSVPVKGHAVSLTLENPTASVLTPGWNQRTQAVHFYTQNTFKVSSPLKMTGIKIVYNKEKGGFVQKFLPDVGKCKYGVTVDKKRLAVVWSGESREVVFTHTGGSGVFQFTEVEITFSAPALTVPAIATREGYTTFYSDKAFLMPVGLEGTAVNYDGENLVTDWAYPSGTTVPALTPLLLHGTQGESYTTSVVTEHGGTPPADNLLVGTLADETPSGEGKYYLLTYSTVNGEEVLGFYLKHADGSAFENKAGKACLRLPSDVSPAALKGFALGGVATSIDSVVSDTATDDQPVYTLSGRRIAPSQLGNLPAGVYIRGGKKFIVR